MKVYKCLHCDKKIESLTLPQDWVRCAGDRFICPECITNCRVSDLRSFPFDDFQDFQKARTLGDVKVGVDESMVKQWALKGRYTPKKAERVVHRLVYFVPFLVVLSFVIYSLVSRSWLLLLALPLFPVAYTIFWSKFLGLIRTIPIILMHAGFIYSVIRYDPNWLAITLVLMVIFYAQRAMYRIVFNSLTEAIFEYEDFLCVLWLQRLMHLIYKDTFFAESLSEE
ncbi:hypothetical protein ACFLVA_00050 [Chloroflexota bacterium]